MARARQLFFPMPISTAPSRARQALSSSTRDNAAVPVHGSSCTKASMTRFCRASAISPAGLTWAPVSTPRPGWGHWSAKSSSTRLPAISTPASKKGARVAAGGKRHGDRGYFVQPTVLTNTKPNMKVVQEEIFGPVVCAESFSDADLDRMAREANDTSLWTCRQRLDSGSEHRAQDGAAHSFRHRVDQLPQRLRRFPSLWRIQTIWLGT